MLGLVMEGGAMRGMFTAGVTDVLMEANVTVDGAMVGQYRTNMGGKLSISLEMDNGAGKTVRIQK